MIPFLLLVCFVAMTTGQQEPCEKYVSITDERRSIRYRAPAGEPNICDSNIDENMWYRFQVLPPERIHDQCVEALKCGTEQPVWLRGNHPTAADPGPKEVDVCSPLGNDCCGGWKSTISVKFCRAAKAGDDDYYVYRLKRLPHCDMAYCAGDGDICKRGTAWNPNSKSCTEPRPNITAPVFDGPIIVEKTLHGRKFDDFCFACNVRWFNPDTQKKGEQFEVVFTFDGQEVTSVAPKITDGSNLQVKLWSKELKGHVGKAVGCKVRSYWKVLERLRSDYQVAQRTYYVGIRYSTTGVRGSFISPRIEIDEKSPPVTLYFNSTVPISCPETTYQTSCKFSVTMVDIAAKDDLGVLECSITFSGLASQLPTQMIKAQSTPGIKKRLSVLRFRPIDTNPEFFWDKFQMPDVTIAISDTSTSGICHSVGDPHFRTFDGRYYHIYTEGDYVLAKSTKRYFEVHVRQQKCWAVACNCAVAVREGNNVIGVYACKGTKYNPTPITYLKDKNVPGATITRIANRYILTMPSGAYIIVDYSIYLGVSYLNIFLYLNSEDYGQTSGLCGVWNGNPGDDTVVKGTTRNDGRIIPIEFSYSYLLKTEESYINGYVKQINCLNITDLLPNICTCQDKQAVTCAAPDKTLMTFDTKFTDACNGRERTVEPAQKRRDVDSSKGTSGEENRRKDMVITEDDIPIPQFDEKHGVNVTLSWPTASGITEEQAKRHCQAKMESSPVYQLCKDRIGQNSETTIASCVADAQLMDNLTTAAETIAIQFQTICVHQLQISVVSNGSSIPTQEELLLANVMSMICPNQCNGNGNCRNGTCVCNDGFAGEDCSVNTRKPPQLSAFRKNTTCDFRSSFCLEISIFASNFFYSERLSCKVSAVNQSRNFTFGGSIVSTREVICRLPAVHRFTNQTADVDGPAAEVGPAALYRWDIALTNDGSLYSNILQLLVYDSKCQECGSDGTCTQKNDTCVIEGRCFQSGEASRFDESKKCIPSKSRDRWSRDGNGDGKVYLNSATALNYSISILTAILIAIFGIEASLLEK